MIVAVILFFFFFFFFQAEDGIRDADVTGVQTCALPILTQAGIAHGYLENQAFAPAVVQGRAITWARGASLTGRPYLARAAEEHSGPHMPWFWRGELQGGGVLNDMMCHSALVVRHLLTKPGAPSSSV